MRASLPVCGALLVAYSSFAQNYSIDWFTIDGGGDMSTGGPYSVSGSIGQPDAGRLSSGSYAVEGGFWGIISAVQMPGAPLLTVRLTATNTIAVSWPSPSEGFSLYQNSGLNATNWTLVGTSPSNDGTSKTVIFSPNVGNRYYRLANP